MYTNYRVQGATLSGARTYYGVIKFFGGQFSRIVRFSYVCRVVNFDLPGGSKYKFAFRKIQNLQHDTFIVYGYNFVDLLETVSSIYFVLYLLSVYMWVGKQMKIEPPPPGEFQ